MKQARLLTADEIECRVQSVKMGKGSNSSKCFAVLLLYKDARCDMKLLDETYGPENWQRDHKTENNNLFCGIGIWDELKGCWVWKWDAGSESNQDAEKGHASDSFKRAGFNWGIGRELYTSPFIYLELQQGEFYMQGDKPKCGNIRFEVMEITYDESRCIRNLVISDAKGVVRYKR